MQIILSLLWFEWGKEERTEIDRLYQVHKTGILLHQTSHFVSFPKPFLHD